MQGLSVFILSSFRWLIKTPLSQFSNHFLKVLNIFTQEKQKLKPKAL